MELLDKLISPVHEVMDARMGEYPVCTHESPKNVAAARTCDAAVIGNIHREMIRTRGALLSKSADKIKESVAAMGSFIFSMMRSIQGTHRPSYQDMPSCCPQPRFRVLAKSIHNGIPAVVARWMKQSYEEYMAKQRTKTGLTLATKGRKSDFKPYYWDYV